MENSKFIEFKSKVVSATLSKTEENVPEVIKVTDVTLPTDAPARMKTLKSEGRKWYLTVVYRTDSESPFALFCHTNHNEKSASTSNALELLIELAQSKGILDKHIQETLDKSAGEPNISKLTRTISLLLRHGVAIKNIVIALDRVEEVQLNSFLFQIKKFLAQYIRDGEIVENTKCDCGGTLVFSEGCMSCLDCGNSKCG